MILQSFEVTMHKVV